MPKKYRNFNVDLFEYRKQDGKESCRVASQSKAGEDRYSDAPTVQFPDDLRERIAQLEQRELSFDLIYALGVDIGKLLFPGEIRNKLLQSLPRTEEELPLRICIKCDGFPLETIPWEYAYLDRNFGGPRSPSGFVVLNSDTSVVRYQILSRPSKSFTSLNGRPLRIVAALSAPEGGGGLDLAQEKRNLEQSLLKVGTVAAPVYLDRVTCTAFLDAVNDQLTDIVHFAGHGAFVPPPHDPDLPPTGHLIFETDAGDICYYSSEQLAVDLGDKNIRLVVLAACQSAAATAANAWAGVAPALVREGIPAVVGMQFSVQDKAAVGFGERFYRSLAGGLTIDEAMAEGRKAILRECPGDRDFGVPVLYLRCDEESDAVLFPTAAPARHHELPPVIKSRAPDLSAVLDQIAQLRDYKQLHDALDKSRMGGLNHMHESIDHFPALSRTVRTFRNYVTMFRIHLLAIEDVLARKKCAPNLVEALHDAFRSDLDALDAAIAAGDKDALKGALADFESTIANNLDRINEKMTATAGSLDLDSLIEFLRSTGGMGTVRGWAEGALDDLAGLSRTLREKVDLHNEFQRIDNKLTLIKRKQPNEYAELVKHWTNLRKLIIALHPRWPVAPSDEWTEIVESITCAVAESDARKGQDEFIGFCSILQTGFSNIDTDLLRICGEVQTKAAQSIAGIQHATSFH